ncbi:MAG: hypothetical protein DRN15_05200 [Thermoprotei archaeon]|nr:MAG: hypothetical protein DRN15_05200 [Thermoprotei archaeon]RLF24638.1 MAG: hypothetical protein DRM97_03180 [Thermoprotei archaeon]
MISEKLVLEAIKELTRSHRGDMATFRARDVGKVLGVRGRGGSLVLISAYLDHLAEQGLLEVKRNKMGKKYIIRKGSPLWR